MRQRRGRVFSGFFVGLVLAVVLLAASADSAGAKNAKHAKPTKGAETPKGAKHNTCTGSADNFPTELGTLSGTTPGTSRFPVLAPSTPVRPTINGNVTVESGSTLIAAFSSSPLTVTGNVKVESGGTLVLGCFASSFGCFDDPDQNNPTLNGPATVGGNIIARNALGVIVHDTSIGGNVHPAPRRRRFHVRPAGRLCSARPACVHARTRTARSAEVSI